jgi:hypothetical protein
VSLHMYFQGPRVLHAVGPRDESTVVPVSAEAWKQAPPAVRDQLTLAEAGLAALGFGVPTRGASMRTNASSCFSLVEHAEGHTLASVVVMITSTGRSSPSLLFESELADGTHVSTANSAAKRRFPRVGGSDSISFPEARDAAALYAMHRLRVSTLAAGAPTRPVTRGADPLEHQRREGAEFYARMVAAGYYRPTGDGRHALTRRGAAFFTWRGLFPWAQVTDWRDERRRDAWRRRAHAA